MTGTMREEFESWATTFFYGATPEMLKAARCPEGTEAYGFEDNDKASIYLTAAYLGWKAAWEARQPSTDVAGLVDSVWMYKGNDGEWKPFMNEQHRLNTLADGGWDVREFFTTSCQENIQPAEQQPDVSQLVEALELAQGFLRNKGYSEEDPLLLGAINAALAAHLYPGRRRVMSKLMKYKGYEGSAEVSFEDKVLYGKILHIRDLIMYEGDSVEAIKEAFEAAVDDYLADCLEPAHSYEGMAGIQPCGYDYDEFEFFRPVEPPALYAAPQPAEQQTAPVLSKFLEKEEWNDAFAQGFDAGFNSDEKPAPDVTQLVVALEAIERMDYSDHSLINAVLVARAALAAYRKRGDDE